MPKISLHVEADSAEEYLAILAAIRPPLLLGGQHTFPQSGTHGIKQAEAPAQDFTPYPDPDPVEEPAPEQERPLQVMEELEKVTKARKPRGPNKPKMAPVTEEAPEEVEHVGTVAVGNGPVHAQNEEILTKNEEVLTRMDLGDTIAGYVRKYGINFAQTDVSKMLQDMFGADVRKKSDVPDDQKSLRQAIATITQATIDNPYNRKVDVNG